MDLIRSMHPLARAWLLDDPLSLYIDAFQASLERGRYAEGSSAAALPAWSHFAHWMTKCQLSAEQIDEALVQQFLDSLTLHPLLQQEADQDLPWLSQPYRVPGEPWTRGIKPVQVFICPPVEPHWLEISERLGGTTVPDLRSVSNLSVRADDAQPLHAAVDSRSARAKAACRIGDVPLVLPQHPHQNIPVRMSGGINR